MNGGAYSKSDSGTRGASYTLGRSIGEFVEPAGRYPANLLHCPKASRAERELGCEGLAGRSADSVRNFHPTVKPVRLMRYLCRLVTPPGGTVLDAFSGSGSCGVAAVLEGFDYIGAELEAHARAYPTSWAHTAPGFVGDADDTVEVALKAGQMGLFG